jgi:hypothetical protein
MARYNEGAATAVGVAQLSLSLRRIRFVVRERGSSDDYMHYRQ